MPNVLEAIRPSVVRDVNVDEEMVMPNRRMLREQEIEWDAHRAQLQREVNEAQMWAEIARERIEAMLDAENLQIWWNIKLN